MPPFSAIPNQEEYFSRVWALVRRVPPGKVVTYGQVAMHVAPPQGVAHERYRAFGARWVGSAMANCPDDVPWQRVVNSQGKISQRPGGHRQQELLENEGVVFSGSGKINLKIYGWDL